MTILSIRTVGDPVLRSVCDPITVFDDDLARLIDDMLETMYDVGGVGLAGPQVGISKQIFTFGGIDDREGYIINPVLEVGEEDQEGGEGCLSVPGQKSATPRKNWARVTGVDPSYWRAKACSRACCSTKPTTCTASCSSTASWVKTVSA